MEKQQPLIGSKTTDDDDRPKSPKESKSPTDIYTKGRLFFSRF